MHTTSNSVFIVRECSDGNNGATTGNEPNDNNDSNTQ